MPRLAPAGSAAALLVVAACKAGGSAPSGDDAAPSAAADAALLRVDGGALNATPLPAASVDALVNPDRLPAYGGPTGSVEGTITVTGDPARPTPQDFSRCPDAERTWGRAFREGPPDASGKRPLADALVVVTGYVGFFLKETREAREVRIERCAPTERTVTLTFGQRLDVKNLSSDFWTPVLEPGATGVLMMATPNGDPARIYPKKPGRFLLGDHDRKYARVDVYAFLHPLHTASATTGYYRIDGVPVGKLRVSTTHPQFDRRAVDGGAPVDVVAEQDVTVAAGVVHRVDLTLRNVNQEPAAGADSGASPAAPLR